jgi:leader peptidase (prepilin peptidase)/N-methyltransferase
MRRSHHDIRSSKHLPGRCSPFRAVEFGYGWAAAGATLLISALVALTFIDIDTQLLPDSITLPLVWAGLLFNLSAIYTDLHSAVIGAIAGYLSLWIGLLGIQAGDRQRGDGLR